MIEIGSASLAFISHCESLQSSLDRKIIKTDRQKDKQTEVDIAEYQRTDVV